MMTVAHKVAPHETGTYHNIEALALFVCACWRPCESNMYKQKQCVSRSRHLTFIAFVL